MTERETSVLKEHTPRPMAPEDNSYRDVVMQLSDHPVKPKYWFEDFGDYWSCSCGQINRSDTCSNCGLERELLRRLFHNNGIPSSPDDPVSGTISDVDRKISPSSNDHTNEPASNQNRSKEDPSQAAFSDPDQTGSGSAGHEYIENGYDNDQYDDREAIEYQRRKHRTKRLLIIILFLFVLLGTGLAVFYYYGLPEMDRQENMEVDAARDSLASELPETVKPLGENDFEIDQNLGDHYYDNKEYEKAIEHYSKALKIRSDDSIRHKINAAKFSYVNTHQEEGGAVFEDYLEDLHKAKYSGIQDIYNRYYTWKTSIVANTGPNDYSTDMSSINRINTIYFHTTFSGGPPDDTLDLYYEIVWPDGTSEKRAISGSKGSGETLTTTCQYTYPATQNEGRLTYKLYNNSNNKQIATDSVTLL